MCLIFQAFSKGSSRGTPVKRVDIEDDQETVLDISGKVWDQKITVTCWGKNAIGRSDLFFPPNIVFIF
jgi:hypothetical protein